jgi:hypothetical protein
MKKLFWIIGFGGGLLTSCNHLQSQVPKGRPTAVLPNPAIAVRSIPGTVTVPRTVTVKPSSAKPPALPVPSLIPPVSPGTSAPSGVGDRPDPFSSLPLNPVVVIKPGTPLPNAASPGFAPSVVPTAPVTAPVTVPVPAPVTAPVPAIQPPVPVATTPVVAVAPVPPPTLPAPVIPPVAPPAPKLAETIAISGVVQAGSRISIIVQVPNESSTRYAAVGDYLANGRVLVKRIENQGSEPIVVLEQDGAEFIKSVGSGGVGAF